MNELKAATSAFCNALPQHIELGNSDPRHRIPVKAMTTCAAKNSLRCAPSWKAPGRTAG
jgi:hypothetical protein